MKIVSGRDALIAVALGFQVYTRPKSELVENRVWSRVSDNANIRLFLGDESNQIFEYGVEVKEG
ncbi:MULTISPECIES: hypothetical protein [Acinetobacter calcoaceticus/baumannii complex]|uniref:Uncharacterized protein n=2 Tax=Acinetobacter baumannii TaxID=470 RepID=A0A6I4HK78_ACIBA|nr:MULTISPECIES: hypothetical protein [Acinetobacter calcoaceticus/baumannii complex]KAB1101797.1 hypothetical protein F6W73_02730 [Acinetobacter baumannii]KAF0626464.1 hypothetical protein AB71198_03127 [Acinetobacter baumannii]KQK37486.1 hypothetical protein AQ483_02555 [Acinetobacter baumannii]KQK43093.1 hypothetical protein AQ484_11105 [Acinetobacter baumannii]MBF6871020.1 hypothetical protein [Acinetobacter baumannii]